MSKKAILSTLLISSALLGTATAANAATSAVKPEKKLVSVEKSNAKIYKNSKLQESKTVKKGTVYKVDGYRNINDKKYYRVYQEDTKGKVVYKGYILDKDTKVLKGQKPAKADRLVALTKDDQTAWKNLYFNKKIKTYDGTKHSSNFEVKYSYNIGGKKYFSLYRGEKWMGYMDGSAFKVLTPENVEESQQDYEVVKDYDTYSDIYFTENGQLKVGEKVKVKRIYTFGTGRQYGSLYDKDGKWIGYANMKALQAIKDTTPEKPDTKPEPDKPGTGGSTGDSGSGDTGNKPGDSGTGDSGSGSHPGSGDQGSSGDSGTGDSGSGDTGNTPGEGGTGDSGSGSQPGGGDQGGSGDTGTGGGTETPEQPTESELDKAKKEAKEAIDKAEQELKDAKATNASKEAAKKVIEEAKKTLEGGKLEDIKQIPSKVDQAIKDLQPLASEEETKSLDKAISDAEKVIENKDALNGVDKVEKALEEAKKVKVAAGKGNAGQKEVADATKAVNDAIKEITLKPSKNKESIEALHNAIEKLKETQKLGADNLVNNEKYNEVLTSAEKVLENAVAGKVGKEAIEAETTKVNDFINKLQLNTEALNKKIDAVKSEGNKVYMTKEQETQFNDFITKAKEAAENTKLSNTNKLKEIDENLKKAEDFIKGQPTEADVKELIKATEKEQEVVGKLKGKEDQIFQNWDDVKTKDDAADQMLTEIKKDKSPSENTADKKYTAEQVKTTAKELMDSMANLEVNHNNLRKYDEAAKAAIAELDPEHKEEAEKLLTSFEVAAEDASVKYLNQMAKAADSLNKEIHGDQVQEINSVIEKAKRIEGVSSEDQQGNTAPNAKFYETGSYTAMNSALTEAEVAEKKLEGKEVTSRSKRSTDTGATQVQNGKEAARTEKDLKEKINALQVKDWDVNESTDGVIKLTKYTGHYTSTATTKKGDEQVIEIPGSLKDKQVVVESSKDKQLFDAKNDGAGKVEVKFETATDNRKPKTGADFSYAFANNKEIGTVDVTELDTTDMTKMENTFMNDFYLNKIEGSEKLVHKGVTSLKAAFAGTNLQTLNASGWDTSDVTNMRAMFKGSNITTVTDMEDWDTSKVTDFNYMFGATKFKTLDLSKWAMNAANNSGIKSMFRSSNSSGGAKAEVTEVTLPDHFKGKPEDIVAALKDAGTNKQLAHDVKVNRAEGQQVGTVNTSGNWEGFGEYNKENVITEDKEVLNNPVALCNTLMHSEKLNDNETVKKFAKFLNNVAYPVWMYSTGNKVISSRDADYSYLEELQGEPSEYNAGLQNNDSWENFEKRGSGHYYQAIQLLQEYAKNAKTNKNEEVKKLYQDIVDDMAGMRVVPTKLQNAIKEAEKVNAKVKDNSLADKIAEAKSIVDGKNSARLNLENWQHIVELTRELIESTKTVSSK